jgi:uncharacterized protein (DUF1499 family)
MNKSLFILFCGLIMTQSNSFAENKTAKPCPDSPNCVSSLANDSRAIEPFTLIVDPLEGWQKIISTLSKMERVKVIHSSEETVHAEATSLIFRFVDDIDLAFNKEEKRIDIRSASRIGYSDFGINRKRLEELRARLQHEGVIQ